MTDGEAAPLWEAGQEVAGEPGCGSVDTAPVPALASRQAGAHRPAGWRPTGWVAVSPEILRRVKNCPGPAVMFCPVHWCGELRSPTGADRTITPDSVVAAREDRGS
jgi:hypothetical protein